MSAVVMNKQVMLLEFIQYNNFSYMYIVHTKQHAYNRKKTKHAHTYTHTCVDGYTRTQTQS